VAVAEQRLSKLALREAANAIKSCLPATCGQATHREAPTLHTPCTHPAPTHPHTPRNHPATTPHPPQSSEFNPLLLAWCVQAEVDFAADAGVAPSPQSAFVTCASSLTEGGRTSSHADDTRALMTAVLLGGISQDDLTVWYLLCCSI